MNRENKRKTFEKGYYKTHRCNDTFSCRVCDRLVFPTPTGGDHRNHCPNCLSSLHVDQEPGDRAADCGGIMDPIGVWVRKKEEWAVIHRCRLMSIALKPLSLPPFPLERIEQLTDAMGGSGSLGTGGRTP